MTENVLQQISRFSETYGRELPVRQVQWRYYRLGQGPALLWLTGGLRRAAFGFGFMECLASRFTIIAPDFPPLMTFNALSDGFDALLQAERVEEFHLGGQSYGGLLAQGYLARHPSYAGQLVLSSTGPADYGRAWALIDDLCIFLARVLPERRLKAILAGGLEKIFSVPEVDQAGWRQALRVTLEDDLTRADVISHFAVAADLIRKKIVYPGAYQSWAGEAVVLSAENDPTQGKGDQRRFEALLGRPVRRLSLGPMGHTAALLDPAQYADILASVLS